MAKKIISSGLRYDSKELLELGVIDEVVGKGEARGAAKQYIRQHTRRANGFNGIKKVSNLLNKVEFSELLEIGKIWVDHALNLSENDLKLMERLVKGQNKYKL
jgi:DSF synthase